MTFALRCMSAVLLLGSLVFVSVSGREARADSDSMFPGWNTVASTNWDAKTPIIQNWRQMLTRWAGGKDCNSDTCSSAGWAKLISDVKGAGDTMAQLNKANALINDASQHPYIEDLANWKIDEYWETPYEFLKKSGDAEDFAIAKYFLLRAAGVPVVDMQIVAVRLKSRGGIGHAVLAVRTDSTHAFILDNLVDQVMGTNLTAGEFTPVVGANEANWRAYTPQ